MNVPVTSRWEEGNTFKKRNNSTFEMNKKTSQNSHHQENTKIQHLGSKGTISDTVSH
jgi:hypothetical protein